MKGILKTIIGYTGGIEKYPTLHNMAVAPPSGQTGQVQDSGKARLQRCKHQEPSSYAYSDQRISGVWQRRARLRHGRRRVHPAGTDGAGASINRNTTDHGDRVVQCVDFVANLVCDRTRSTPCAAPNGCDIRAAERPWRGSRGSREHRGCLGHRKDLDG